MNNLASEVGRLVENCSEDDVKIAIGELVKKLIPANGSSNGIRIHDAQNKALGLFVPEQAIANPDMSDYQTFLAVTRYRIANPPEKYMTPEEFISEILTEPS
jgi:hypothetical protein